MMPRAKLSKHRRWTINGRFLTQPVTGVQRYGREIVRALDALLHDEHPLTRGLQLELLVPEASSEPFDLLAIRPRRVSRLSGHLWEQIALPLHARGGVLSLCNTSTVMRGKQIVCIHDLNVLDFPASFSRSFRLLYGNLLPAVARRASVVTTVSRFSGRQLVEHGIAPTAKVAVIPNGHEHALRWVPRASTATDAVGPDTVMVIGSLAPHKNIGMLLSIAEDLARHGIRVAVAGSRDPKVFASSGFALSPGNVLWLGRLSDGELAEALARCLCLAFPSFVEGFGLPPLEAMARGCPVVVSDRTSLPEICGDAALYASPHEPERWVDALVTLQRQPRMRADLAKRGIVRARSYSWRRSAELYLQAMARSDGLELPPDIERPERGNG